MNYKLNEYAEALKVHPRTVLRHVSDKPNPYWTPSYNVALPIEEVAEAFDVPLKLMIKVMRNRDSFLTLKEALEFTGLKKTTFQWRGYDVALRKRKIVRYLYSRLVDQHLAYLQ